MRTLTPAMIGALTGQETGEVFIVLVTVNHGELAGPLRFSSDPTERHSTDPLVYKTVSCGEDFYFLPMDLVLPTDLAEAPPVASITISNVGRDLVSLIRSVSTPAEVTMELALASDPDTVVTLPVFDLTAAPYDAETVTLRLTIESLATEGYPAGAFDPSGFPALH